MARQFFLKYFGRLDFSTILFFTSLFPSFVVVVMLFLRFVYRRVFHLFFLGDPPLAFLSSVLSRSFRIAMGLIAFFFLFNFFFSASRSSSLSYTLPSDAFFGSAPAAYYLRAFDLRWSSGFG